MITSVLDGNSKKKKNTFYILCPNNVLISDCTSSIISPQGIHSEMSFFSVSVVMCEPLILHSANLFCYMLLNVPLRFLPLSSFSLFWGEARASGIDILGGLLKLSRVVCVTVNVLLVLNTCRWRNGGVVNT